MPILQVTCGRALVNHNDNVPIGTMAGMDGKRNGYTAGIERTAHSFRLGSLMNLRARLFRT